MRLFNNILLISLVFYLTPGLTQSIFDAAVSGEEGSGDSKSLSYEFNGYVRANSYAGRDESTKEAELKKAGGELAIKTLVKKEGFGSGFAEFRVNKGYLSGSEVENIKLREAYVSLYKGALDLKLGEQIVVWGKADGMNPTNNITPMDMTVFSPVEDDVRVSNFLARGYINLLPFRLELIWVPSYRASTSQTPTLSSAITIGSSDYPDNAIKNQSYASKLHLEGEKFDSSVSYYDGYSTTPSLTLQSVTTTPSLAITVGRKTYRQRVYGADFSTSILSPYGLRGEIAYKVPEDAGDFDYTPHKELFYVLGVDKEFLRGDLSIILQYMGKRVFDWIKLDASTTDGLIRSKNRLIWGQSDENMHGVSLRPEYKMLNETLRAEIFLLWNFSAEGGVIKPKLTYDIADDMSTSAGGIVYVGDDDTSYGFLKDKLSAGFVDLKVSF